MNFRVILPLALILFLPVAALASVVGSKHDLRGALSYGSPQEICKVCHIPHRSATESFLIPSERIYSGGSVTIYGGTVGQPGNSSTICLSCHDGTLAPAVGTSSTDFTHSHPFSITYPVKTGMTVAAGGKVTGAYGALPLEGAAENQLECGSCHNPHERGNSGKYLRLENTNSNLCLTCHQK
jgi:predicted CXXCH cytochrome family protein